MQDVSQNYPATMRRASTPIVTLSDRIRPKISDAPQKTPTCEESEIRTLREENMQLKKALAAAEDLNVQLKRISKERANARRGIRPKKQHDGYIVLMSRPWRQQYTVIIPDPAYANRDRQWILDNGLYRTSSKTAQVWKSTLQTPYDASLPLADIEASILQDLRTGDILQDIGCSLIVSSENNGKFTDFGRDLNGIYKWEFIADYRSGLWSVLIYTTHPLTVSYSRRAPISSPKKPSSKHPLVAHERRILLNHYDDEDRFD